MCQSALMYSSLVLYVHLWSYLSISAIMCHLQPNPSPALFMHFCSNMSISVLICLSLSLYVYLLCVHLLPFGSPMSLFVNLYHYVSIYLLSYVPNYGLICPSLHLHVHFCHNISISVHICPPLPYMSISTLMCPSLVLSVHLSSYVSISCLIFPSLPYVSISTLMCPSLPLFVHC